MCLDSTRCTRIRRRCGGKITLSERASDRASKPYYQTLRRRLPAYKRERHRHCLLRFLSYCPRALAQIRGFVPSSTPLVALKFLNFTAVNHISNSIVYAQSTIARASTCTSSFGAEAYDGGRFSSPGLNVTCEKR